HADFEDEIRAYPYPDLMQALLGGESSFEGLRGGREGEELCQPRRRCQNPSGLLCSRPQRCRRPTGKDRGDLAAQRFSRGRKRETCPFRQRAAEPDWCSAALLCPPMRMPEGHTAFPLQSNHAAPDCFTEWPAAFSEQGKNGVG